MSDSPIFSRTSPLLLDYKSTQHKKRDQGKLAKQREPPNSKQNLKCLNVKNGKTSPNNQSIATNNFSVQGSIPIKKNSIKKELSKINDHLQTSGPNTPSKTLEQLKTKYESKITNLNKAVTAQKNEVNSLNKEMEFSRKAFLEVKQENDYLRSKINEASNTPNNYEEGSTNQDYPEVDGPIFDLNLNSMSKAPSALWYRKLFDQNEKLHDQIAHLEDENYTTLEEMQATLQEITDVKKKCDELKEENTALRFERDVVLETLCSQTEKLEQSRLQISNLKHLISSDKTATSDCKDDSVSLNLFRESEKERKNLQEKISELNKTIETLHNDIRIIRDKNAELKSIYEELDSQNEKLVADQEGRLTIIEALKAELNNLKAVTVDENQSQSKLYSDKVIQTLSCVDYESIVTQLKAQLEQLKDFNQQLTNKFNQKERDIKDSNELTERLKDDISRLNSELNSVQSELQQNRRDWEQYEHDLLVSVRVADEYKVQMEVQLKQIQTDFESLQTKNAASAQPKIHKIEQYSVQCQIPDTINFTETSTQTLFPEQTSVRTIPCPKLYLNSKINCENVKVNYQRQVSDYSSSLGDITSQSLSHAKSLSSLPCFPASPDLSLPSRVDELIYQTSKQQKKVRTESSSESISGEIVSIGDNNFHIVHRHERMLASVPNDSQSTSVKNIIQSIEKQLSHKDCLTSDYITDRVPTSYRKPNPVQRHKSGPSKLPSPKSMNQNGDQIPANSLQRQSLDNAVSMTRSSTTNYSSSGLPSLSIRDSLSHSISKLPTILYNPRFQSATDLNHYHQLNNTQLFDPLDNLVKQKGGSRRNCLLSWCQNRTASYEGIEITNFSTSWNDGRALCALLHSYRPFHIDYKKYFHLSSRKLNFKERCKNISLLTQWADKIGISTEDKVVQNMASDKPDWNIVMSYVIDLFKHLESSVGK